MKYITVSISIFLFLLGCASRPQDGLMQPVVSTPLPAAIIDDEVYQQKIPFLSCSYGYFTFIYANVGNDYELEKILEASCLHCFDKLMQYKRYVLEDTGDPVFAGQEATKLIKLAKEVMREASKDVK